MLSLVTLWHVVGGHESLDLYAAFPNTEPLLSLQLLCNDLSRFATMSLLFFLLQTTFSGRKTHF